MRSFKRILQLDYTGMMRSVKNPNGFTKEELYSLEPKIKNAHSALLQKRNQGDLDFSAKLKEMKEQVPEIKKYADHVASHYENFVLLGMGGSALGPQAVHQALLPYYYNELTPKQRNHRPRFYVIDNIDPTRFKTLLSTLDLHKTLFNVVSKSGSTSETMALFLIVRELLKEVCGERFHEHIVVTTDKEKGNLVTLAQREGYQHFVIPCGIGGRFSELTPVGLLPAAVCGIHISELLEGAIALDELIREKSDIFENPAQLRAAFSYLSLKQWKTISVFMPYVDGLKTFADWYAQLWAESLGKRFNRQGEEVCTGQTPVKALGVTDQHSQIQLYTEGPNDKIFTFVTVEKLHEDIRITKDPELDQSLQFLGDHGLGELLQAEFTATEYALTLAGRLHQNIRMPELSAYTVGQLILLLEWETAYMGELLDINAFDQPGVEEGKIGTYALMGRLGYKPHIVMNLAAQAGVRYSIENPDSYIQSNIIGFYNILEACRHNPVEHLVYASSSSVYGANTKVLFSTEDKVDNPVSLYAATKKSNELMAHTYSQLYGIPSTGLRFFTVYGPMGRPDMAYFGFTQKIFKGEPIKVFNYGDCYRDFTYIDDIVESVARILCNPPAKKVDKDSILDGIQYAVYNIGNNQPEQLMDYIAALEKALSKAVGREVVAKKEFLPMQPGDVKATYSDSTPLERDFDFKPSTGIEEGLQRFADWYVGYYGVK